MKTLFAHHLEVRFRDCDPMGHANNAVYLTYFEQARFAHWRSLAGGGLTESPGDLPGVILARAEVDYKVPARYGETLEVRIGLGGIGRTSFTYEYEIVNADGNLVAAGRSVQVMFDYSTNTPVPVPDDIRRLLTGEP
jgi:acyl-CoA thioester hydrolase